MLAWAWTEMRKSVTIHVIPIDNRFSWELRDNEGRLIEDSISGGSHPLPWFLFESEAFDDAVKHARKIFE